jgi:hypoxanthine phosphoribosyltransferase
VTDKVFLSANRLLQDSYDLAAAIFQDGYRPNFVVGVWRGGTPVAIAVHELLHYCGVKADHCSVRTLSYQGIELRDDQVKVDGLDYLAAVVGNDDKILIVDDVHDTGLSFKVLRHELRNRLVDRPKVEIRLASLYYKPCKSQVDFEPDYYVHACDDWLVFPHELDGLSAQELAEHKPGIERVRQLLLSKATE